MKATYPHASSRKNNLEVDNPARSPSTPIRHPLRPCWGGRINVVLDHRALSWASPLPIVGRYIEIALAAMFPGIFSAEDQPAWCREEVLIIAHIPLDFAAKGSMCGNTGSRRGSR